MTGTMTAGGGLNNPGKVTENTTAGNPAQWEGEATWI